MSVILRAMVILSACLFSSVIYASGLSAGDYGAAGTAGHTECGGLKSDGSLQPPCSVKEAIFEGDAVGECPAGSFFDVGLWSCWSCPQGYDRSAAAVDSDRACAKPNPSRRGQFVRATLQGGICPDGSFFDPTRGGECWSCPSGFNRSAAPVEWADACVKPAEEKFKRISRHGRATGLLGTDCPSGQFWDPKDGHCYSCPGGYNRTGYAVDHARACSQVVQAQQSKATLTGQAKCQVGEIFDIRNGGECWTCPQSADRTVYPINGAKACEIGGGFDFARATQTSALTCPVGQMFDFVNARDTRVRNQVKKKYNGSFPAQVGKSGGGSCWSCPVGYRRTVLAVWDRAACESNGISWKAPEYQQPGLFGLDGAETVVLELISNRTTIETIAADVASSVKMTEEESIDAAWQEIHDAPHTSAILALAVMSRLEVAAMRPQEASEADKKLLKSFAEAVVHFRTFLAEQSLQAYQAWDKADRKKNEVYSTVMVAGVTVAAAATTFGTTAALAGMGVEAVRNELWPLPDFTDITLESVLMDQVKGEAVGFVYGKVLLSKPVLNKLFPETAAKTIRKTLTKGAEKAEQAVARYALQTLSKKAAEKAAAKGATLTSKMVMSAVAKAGPQIIVDLAIETVIAWVEMQIERANAEPTLNALLAEARRPFDVPRLLATGEGSQEVEGQWSTVLGAETLPQDKRQIQAAVKEVQAARMVAISGGAAMQKQIRALRFATAGDDVSNVIVTTRGDAFRVIDNRGRVTLQRFKPSKSGGTWENLGNDYVDVASAHDGGLWYLKNDDKLVYSAGSDDRVISVDGTASALTSDAQGELWVVSERLDSTGGEVWLRQNHRWQKKVGLKAHAIAQQGGYLWAVDGNGNIYRSEDSDASRLVSSKMQKIPGKALDIDVGVDGAVVVLGTDNRLYLWHSSASKWTEGAKVPEGTVRIAVRDASTVWALTEKGQLFYATSD
ncbi:tectonin domain-containing protein [Thalassolituus sp.]|uniref:tectonin domain-containing protein n=1 Tax=Thalassolituus sp. TaxID=2030822 RepID=UPI003518E693